MRIASQNSVDLKVQQVQGMQKSNLSTANVVETMKPEQMGNQQNNALNTEIQGQEPKFLEEKVDEAIEKLNEFLEIDHKTSKFVKHEGLDKYYVRLVDAETEEVIKEIPPERLLDAFYEMQKLVGMIVDEKI